MRQTYAQVLAEAKAAFKDLDRSRSSYEKSKARKAKAKEFPKLKSVGFVNGTRDILVYM